ncbi:TonB-dependent receptor [Sphingomonas sp. HMWF008]|nr:TonB-dependent receptor [Sphingomonas sp. HMWF008]
MTSLRRQYCAALLTATVVQACLIISPASAQTAPVAFDLPAQSLETTLRAIARQTGREILFADDDVRGRRSPPIRGSFTVEQAVRLALGGSDLVVDEQAGALVVKVSPRPAQDSAAEGTITVTGTRIRGATGPSPVTVLTRRGLEEQGIPDVASVSRIIPQNFTGGQNPGVAGGGEQGGYSNVNNSTTLNLRGLGSDATLTLIDGHRLPYDAVNQGVDISTIPFAALDRIEIITDGASALYGSDAVGGVANLRLRRDYEGLQAGARVGATTQGGAVQQQYSGLAGKHWTGGGFMAAVEFSKATPIYADQRSYTSSLRPEQMLATGSRQVSAVLAGHQAIADGIWFELDAQFADRRSRKDSAFSVTAPLTFLGQVSQPVTRSYAITPSLHLRPGGGWEATLQATEGESSSAVNARRYTSGALLIGESTYDDYLTNFEASAEGPLIRLPGGVARLALGGGYRRFRLDFDVRSTTGGITTVSRNASERRQSVFGYGELSVPLIGPANRMPLVEALRLSAAVRYERYTGIDEVATPKLGLVYAPYPDITLKYSWGRSFKIPTLNQVNQARQAVLLSAALFAPQPVPALPPGSTVLLIGGGNPDLRAERATSSTLSIEVKPRFLDGLSVEANWFDIKYRGRIASPISSVLSALTNPAVASFVQFSPTTSELQSLIATSDTGLANQSGQPYDPAKVVAVIDSSLRNTAQEHIRGVDLAIDYRAQLGRNSRLQMLASASYLDSERQAAVGLPSQPTSGIIFTPSKFRAHGSASWETSILQVSASLNYAGSNLDKRFPVATRIGAFTTLDLSGAFHPVAGKGLFRDIEFRLSVQNLLNEEPDPIRISDPSYVAFDSTNQSPVGRVVSFSVTKQW